MAHMRHITLPSIEPCEFPNRNEALTAQLQVLKQMEAFAARVRARRQQLAEMALRWVHGVAGRRRRNDGVEAGGISAALRTALFCVCLTSINHSRSVNYTHFTPLMTRWEV